MYRPEPVQIGPAIVACIYHTSVTDRLASFSALFLCPKVSMVRRVPPPVVASKCLGYPAYDGLGRPRWYYVSCRWTQEGTSAFGLDERPEVVLAGFGDLCMERLTPGDPLAFYP